MLPEVPAPDAPVVWLLADGQPGNQTQMLGLETRLRAAGAQAQLKQARANWRHMLGAAILGASGWSLDRATSDPLAAPWPDLVIGTGRRSGPWVRYVKRASGGTAKAAVFGQKSANTMAGLDLGLVLEHWGFPAHPRRESIPLPPTGATPERLAAAAAAEPGLLDPAKAPWTLLIVGGRCFDHDLTPDDAGAVASAALAAARAAGGGLAIVTSRRTGAAAADAIRRAAPDALFFPWDRQPNPFLALLAAADRAIVTGDSESMIAEAIAAGLPTAIHPVRRRWSLRMALERGAAGLRRLGGPAAWAVERLWAAGVLLPPRDLGAMTETLVRLGYAERFPGTPPAADAGRRQPAAADAVLAERLLRLVRPDRPSPP